MVFEITGKVVLVTGGTSGLGYQIIKVLLGKGAKGVAFLGVNESKGNEKENELKQLFGDHSCIFIKADVSEEEQMKAAFKLTVKTYKQLDIVINNAGILADLDWKRSICTNLGGCICGTTLGIDHYLPKYKSGEEGIIVNISSIAGVIPLGMCPVYSSTKHAIIALSRCYGHEKHYERSKVKVIAVCPGHMETPLLLELKRDSVNLEYVKAFGTARDDYPMQKPELVAENLPDIITNSSNGSVWIIEGGEVPYEVLYPNLRKEVKGKV